jgi:hypothetical protein
MKMLRRMLSSVAVLLVLVGTVEAATLFSAPLSANTSGYNYFCRIVNVNGLNTKARDVTLEIVSTLDGEVLNSYVATVAPGTGTQVSSIFGPDAYCRATVAGSKADWRGTFNVEQIVGIVNALTIATTPLE